MKTLKQSQGYEILLEWMAKQNYEPFPFQEKTWAKYNSGFSGLVVAPTGFGKTFSVFLAVISDYLNHPDRYKKGLKLIWVSPLRSLAKDLQRAMQEAVDSIGLDWAVEMRNGDTPQKDRQRQVRNMPDVLVVTPETLHLLFAMKNNSRFFKHLHCIAVDEWHELLGSKRGILVELAISRLKSIQPKLKIWGISATIGNLDQAMEVLIPYDCKKTKITSRLKKKTKIHSVLPDEVDTLPWAGHIGAKMADKIIPIIQESKTCLIFTNTRGQSELWYQLILQAAPELAGLIAIHHGSIDKQLRLWIEDSIASGKLKAVVCTSSLDLGVDFKPVDTAIQIGSVKGIARFLQRAGRSGHSPFETSKIYFIPTHSLELIEISAIKEAVKHGAMENREPMVNCFDVLTQYLVTLAVGEGFLPKEVYLQVMQTTAYRYMTEEEWKEILLFITMGGRSLRQYEEYHKVEILEDGSYKVNQRRIAMLHRMNIGVIVSDAMLKVRFMKGGYIGMVEEYFISSLTPGDRFVLSGRILEFVMIKEMTVYTRISKGKAKTPSWLGGRLPLSSSVSHFMREKLSDSLQPAIRERELKFLNPLLVSQEDRSHIPKANEFLVEMIETRDGHHLFLYPFEGRLVHEVMAALIGYRISKIKPMTFTMAMNDYGFELLSDQPIPVDDENLGSLLSKEHLMDDVFASINATEMAKRKFRDIAVISGLVNQSYPGKHKNFKSLQSSSGLLFQVLEEHEPNHFLLRQAYREVFDQQVEEQRLKAAFDRIANSTIIFKKANAFTPLSFPIKVDSLRSSMSNEDLAARIKRMKAL